MSPPNHATLAPRVSADFDGGNAEVIDDSDPGDIRLRIRKDAGGEFMQWFCFRLTGARDRDVVIHLLNAGDASYRGGFVDYRAVRSSDLERWVRVETSLADGVLTIRDRPDTDAAVYAYFAPYSMERHRRLIARCVRDARVRLASLTRTLDGADLDYLSFGDGPLSLWAIARQHPGETMAEYWMEGFLERLLDPEDAVARALLERATFHVVPNMNPDGSRRGHLRVNACGENLNRAWLEPTLERTPEVFAVRKRMHETGVDFCVDVHGDEELPYNFFAGPLAVPSLTPRLREQTLRIGETLAGLSPDFQTAHGYPVAPPGKANLSMCTNYVAETFGCLALTLEQPFKDANNHPDPVHGWSPERCRGLARSFVDALYAVSADLGPQLGGRA